MINSFQGEHRFLSNFWPAPVRYGGLDFPTVEHAYVAAKTLDFNLRMQIAAVPTPGQVKRLGRTLVLRSDWGEIKLIVMLALTRQKYADETLAALLKATAPHELVEGNTWGDTFWGVCNGKGANHLGQILMQVRAELL